MVNLSNGVPFFMNLVPLSQPAPWGNSSGVKILPMPRDSHSEMIINWSNKLVVNRGATHDAEELEARLTQ